MDNQQQQQIEILKSEVKKLEESIQWYKRTYEDRRLIGIIKDRLKQYWEKKMPLKNQLLEDKIKTYIHQNPHTVKKLSNPKSVSIIMLSYNRIEDTKRAIKNIYQYTTVPFELIILDNNSTDEVKEELKRIAKKYSNIKIILETTNLGCAKGRVKATRYSQYNYLLYVDNDIMVTPYYLENLISTLEKEEAVAGVCCKVIFPNGKIQFNGGRMVLDDQYALYSLHDEGLDFDDYSTNRFLNCEWIPGGATLWKREIFERFGIDEEMKGSFEDNEISYRIIKSGYKLLNSPASIVIHDHYDFKSSTFKEKEIAYFTSRNNESRIREALIHFFNKHELIFSFSWKNNPWDLIWKLDSKDSILQFIRENNLKNEYTDHLWQS